MKKMDYTKSSKPLRDAYFKWRDKHAYLTANVMSFAAGWNAAMNAKSKHPTVKKRKA